MNSDDLELVDPTVTIIDRRSNIKTYDFNNLSIPGLNSDFSFLLSPKYLSLTDLYKQIDSSSSSYRKNLLSLEFWRKILQPFITLSLVLLALGFLFGPMRDQKSGQRIVIAIGVAFSVDLIQKLLGSISIVSNIPSVVAVLTPILLITLLAFLLLKKVN